jgi:hypothetical protein
VYSQSPRLGVVDIFVARHSAVDGLAQEVSQRKLCVLAPAGVGQVLCNEFAQAQTFIQFAHDNQAAVGSDPRALEIDLQRRVKRELKGLILFLTHWVSASGAS